MIEAEKTDKELVKETEKIVDNAKEEVITPEIKSKQEIKKVTKKEVEKVLNAINGVAFKFGDVVFKIKYVNVGQKRFSADCVNMES